MRPRTDADPPQIAGVILAAGAARRFGAQKLLAPLGGRPLVQHVIDAANASCLEDIVLVVGTNANDLVAQLEIGRTRVVQNPDPARGLASSLQSGLRSLDQSLHAALVLLGDMPGVTTALIDELVARGRETRASAVVSVWRGRRSPPVVLHKSIWPAALALDGDIGMREVLAGRNDVVEVEVTPNLGALDDVDTPEDHGRLRVRGDTRIASRRSDGGSSAP
ncbi:MAG: nucleotidyltransferase family protein [Chloroflexota bacterium]